MGENPWVVEEESNKPLIAPSDGKPDTGSAGQLEQNIKKQVVELLRGFQPEREALRKALSATLGMADGGEDAAALFGCLWMSDDPLAMIDNLHEATRAVLSNIAAERKKMLQDIATRILGYLLLSVVSREWVEGRQGMDNPFHDIPLDKKISLEVTSASLNGTAACLSHMTRLDLHGVGADAVETFVPEGGWQEGDTFANVVKGLYKSLRPDEKAETLSRIEKELADGKKPITDLQHLNAHFKTDHRRGINNHYLAVNRHNLKHPAQDFRVCQQLKEYLPHLLVIRFGASAEGDCISILQGDEGEMAYLVEDFLNLFNDINREGQT